MSRTIGLDDKYLFFTLYNFCQKKGCHFKDNVPFLGVHSTRHTHASLLLDSDATMKEVQERLRHTKISQTLDVYGHLAKETKEKTVEKLVKHLDL
nr:tyrosine-type recombinase/integrase [Enterococcus italicus]